MRPSPGRGRARPSSAGRRGSRPSNVGRRNHSVEGPVPPGPTCESGGKPSHSMRCRALARRLRNSRSVWSAPACWRCRRTTPRLGATTLVLPLTNDRISCSPDDIVRWRAGFHPGPMPTIPWRARFHPGPLCHTRGKPPQSVRWRDPERRPRTRQARGWRGTCRSKRQSG